MSELKDEAQARQFDKNSSSALVVHPRHASLSLLFFLSFKAALVLTCYPPAVLSFLSSRLLTSLLAVLVPFKLEYSRTKANMNDDERELIAQDLLLQLSRMSERPPTDTFEGQTRSPLAAKLCEISFAFLSDRFRTFVLQLALLDPSPEPYIACIDLSFDGSKVRPYLPRCCWTSSAFR